jgi:hypothetical protein
VNYEKPAVNVVGMATAAILGVKISNSFPDNATAGLDPSQYKFTVQAYEADE